MRKIWIEQIPHAKDQSVRETAYRERHEKGKYSEFLVDSLALTPLIRCNFIHLSH